MRICAISFLAFLAAAALAQNRPIFEAASIKVNTSGSSGSSSNGSRGQVMMTNQTLKRLIERAYNVKPFQVIGPGWMENVRFDVAAKYPPNTKDEDRPVMLRTMLEDRFRLLVHRESREASGYALAIVKGGFKLQPVEPGEGNISSKGNGRQEDFEAKKISMAALGAQLERYVGSKVIDGTGIEGVYDVQLHWIMEAEDAKSREEADTAQFAAIQQALGALGLHLRAQKVPVELIVVDKVERVPTEN
jgi:uncharacterized protein (TIGR03435 family)